MCQSQCEVGSRRMGDMWWFILTLLLVSVAESRPTKLKLMKQAKSRAVQNMNNGLVRTDGVSPDVKERGTRAGHVLYGSLKDLNKYQVELYDYHDINGEYTTLRFNLAELVREHFKHSNVMSKTAESTYDSQKNPAISDIEVEKEKSVNTNDEESQEYETYYEMDGQRKRDEIFGEDEYNDYEEDDVDAEKIRVESGSPSSYEELYDEDEKYYDENEQDSVFDEIFMDYK